MILRENEVTAHRKSIMSGKLTFAPVPRCKSILHPLSLQNGPLSLRLHIIVNIGVSGIHTTETKQLTDHFNPLP
jgi:hypothetical protein